MATVEKSLTEAAGTQDKFDYYEREDTIGIALNLKNVAPTFYKEFNFDSMITFNGKCLGACEDGIFELGGDTFAGDDIDAYFTLPTTDLGVANQKRIRSIFAGYESDGTMQAKVTMDDGTEQTYNLSPNSAVNAQEGSEGYGKQDEIGRYIKLKVANVDGADFGFDTIDIIPVLLPKKPSRAALGA